MYSRFNSRIRWSSFIMCAEDSMRSAHSDGAARGSYCIICDRVFVINVELALVLTHFGFSTPFVVIVHKPMAYAFI